MANLLATKPVKIILEEAHETGEHSLRRALGPTNLITLGIGAIIGTGIFVLTGTATALHAGPAIVISFTLVGIELRFCRIVLCRICLHDPCGWLGLHLWLRDSGRDICLDHRLGPGAGIRIRRRHCSFRMERLS